MSVTELSSASEIATPNATMRTYASPAHGGVDLAVWRTEMAPAARGPLHSVDTDQVLIVVEGELSLELDGTIHRLAAGDSALLPAGAVRRASNESARALITVTASAPCAHAQVGEGDPVPVPWTR
jgi:quercetin dioxygenase-like cupin family protein